MVRLALEGEFRKARKIHFRFTELIDTLFIEGNPAGIKAVLAHQGIIENHLRPPLTQVSRGLNNELSKLCDSV
jgi:4-hydroxy-tetrahydrodipicolinate synthase